MSGSSFGSYFRVTTWGESHGPAIGVVVDGCPAGLSLTEEEIQHYLDRRKPGQNKYSTPRKEEDRVRILSGVFEGKTTGTPISMMVPNTSQRSIDYREISSYYRPGHSDMAYDMKYGFRDYRGGGRSSGRETIGRVAAGAIALKILDQFGIQFLTYTQSVGPIQSSPSRFDRSEIFENPLHMPDAEAAEAAAKYLDSLIKAGDSCGGIIECIIKNPIVGIGDPVFEKLDANLGKALLSIGAVKGVEIGAGFHAASMLGSENNDAYTRSADGDIIKLTNHSGGILGGISDGSDIILRAAIKPTPSISIQQDTVTKDGQGIQVCVKGRHDPIIVPRAVVVVEAMAAITLLDMLLASIPSNLENLRKYFRSSL